MVKVNQYNLCYQICIFVLTVIILSDNELSTILFVSVCEAGCPEGWTLSTHAICYFVQASHLTFNDAQTKCLEDGARLVSVWNKAEWELLLTFSVSYTHTATS